MKRSYRKEAYYIDNGILLHGYKDKRGFHPDRNLPCGFDLQILRKKDAGKTWFYRLSDAVDQLKEVEVAGGTFFFSIDDGMAVTRISFLAGDLDGQFTTETIVSDNQVEDVIQECLQSVGIKALHQTEVAFTLVSDLIAAKQITLFPSSKESIAKDSITMHKFVFQ